MVRSPSDLEQSSSRVRGLVCIALFSLSAACTSPAPRAPAPTSPAGSTRSEATATTGALPADWRQQAPREFELWLAAIDGRGDGLLLGHGDWDLVAQALADRPEVAVRAALVLARVPDETAAETLLAHLEWRRPANARGDDAGERTAAAVLAQRDLLPSQRDRLLALVQTGAAAHPEFAVRVECALALVLQGDDRALAFLLAAARHDTPAAEARGEVLTDSPTTAWPRWRAASGLEATLGLAATYDPDMPAARRGALVEDYALRLRAAGRIPDEP